MRSMNVYMIAAALAIGMSGAGVMAQNQGETTPSRPMAVPPVQNNNGLEQNGTNLDQNTNNTANNALEQAGNQRADMATRNAAHQELARVVNDAVTTGKFNDLSDSFSSNDRQKLQSASKDTTELDQQISQFRQDFKAKYGQDFDIKSQAFRDARVYGGQDKNSATVAIMKPSGQPMSGASSSYSGASNYSPSNSSAGASANATPGEMSHNNGTSSAGMSGSASANSGQSGMSGTANESANSSATPSHELASSSTPRAGTSVMLHLTKENGAWKINLPNEVSADQLKSNLTKHIRTLDDQKATWPSDVNEAYKATAYNVLQSFTDTSIASGR